ncbi:MAG TPA: LuxR C-terminal-related transcriptional regulator [Thermoanaerobaculia bacterium]|nr:LuxR C-terminal-related transcriptional regulator [Thermoanaerobaculia bacterium]
MTPSPADEVLAPFLRALEHSPDPVFVTDRLNRVIFWNQSARQLLGFDADEAVGADCPELLRGCDSSGNSYCTDNCPIMQMANRGEVVREFNLTFQTKDAQEIKADVSILQLRAGRPDEFFLVHLMRPKHGERAVPPPPRPHLVTARESDDVRVRKLTTREVEVLGMLAAGRTTPEIAERLHIAPLTARSHIQNILDKLEVHSKAEAVAFAFQKNLL